MANYTDTKVKTLTINRMTKSQYDAAALGSNEFAVTPDTPATTTELGPVKIDGKTIIIDNNGVISTGDDILLGVDLPGTAAAGTRTYGAKTRNYTRSTDTVAGVDDFAKHPIYYGFDAIVKYDATVGKARMVAVKGTYEYNTLLASGDTNLFVVRMFHWFWYKRTVDSSGNESIVLSPIQLPGFKPSPMHYRRGKMYEWVGITKYMFADDGNGGVCALPGKLPKVNTSENAFEQKARAKGMLVMGLGDVSAIQMLGNVKYGTRQWQTAVGRGHCDHPSTQRAVTVAQENASSVIISSSYKSDFSTNVALLLNNVNYEITSIEDYDSSNIKINIVGTVTTTTSSTVRPGLAKTGFSEAILGDDGENVGMASQNGRRTISVLGIEDFYGNAWKNIAGGCKMNNKLFINPDPDNQYAYPTTSDTKGWIESAELVQTLGYIKTLVPTSELDTFTYVAMPKTTGGNADGPICDYVWANANVGPFTLFLGGSVASGSNDGPFCWNLGLGVGHSDWNLSACGVFVWEPDTEDEEA